MHNLPRARYIAAQRKWDALVLRVPIGAIAIVIVPVLVGQIAPGAVQRELLDALLREHAHVDLQAHQREDR